jgi:hypothetical protein
MLAFFFPFSLELDKEGCTLKKLHLQHLESKEFATLDAFILLTCFFVCN